VAPVAGLVAPILIWQLKRDEMPELDEHGKIVVNWLLSSLIYGAIGFILTFFIIGFVVLIGLYVAGLIFPIVGAIKANSGETWNYPLTIRFV
jgi:uncharacterized protein